MFLAINKDGKEWIYEEKPVRHTNSDFWISNSWYIKVPKGTIQRLLDYPLTWDDDCQEIVEYKDKDLKEDKVIKQNIKMRVTPEQSRKVQEICFANGIMWMLGASLKHLDEPFIFINDDHSLGYMEIDEVEGFLKEGGEEIDADLFIRTNGPCEEESTLNDDDVARILKASKDQPIEYLMQKIVNLHDQLNKNRKIVQNQKEEISRLLSQKEKMQQMLMMPCKSVDNDNLVKELKEKDGIIKYLESKLEI